MTHEASYAYDLETPVNCFTMVLVHIDTGMRWIYEISDWQNDAADLVVMIHRLGASGARMVGFNNVNFDYPVLHFIVKTFEAQGYVLAAQIHHKAMQIINAKDEDRFVHAIWPSDRIVPQLDLYRIHHMDNKAKSTSLKALEINMRSPMVQDLPFDPNQPIDEAMRPLVLQYNAHDVAETIRFYHHTLPMIKFRDELSAKYDKDFTNHNDTKIGKDYFIMQLEKALPGACYGADRKPRQTFRRSIPLGSVIFPYITFQTPDFQRVHAYLKATTITNTKEAPELKGLHAVMRGFQFDFGTGGIHGSVNNTVVRADAEHDLIDVDVKSFYPNIAIVNRVYPEHLSETFCDIYSDLYQQRATYGKKTVENAMLKLALNGVYGDSNNVYSPFYDPQYTMAITINGQLLLCMLAESFLLHPEFEIVQINTDGMTMRVPKRLRSTFQAICDAWMDHTRLELETAEYAAMFIRDVNNYLAVSVDGKVKRKGAYQWDTSEPNNVSLSRTWAQDWSALIIPRAAEAVMVNGADLVTFINSHTDPFDFMIRVKVPRSSRLVARYSDGELPIQNTSRYHIATTGPHLFKIMPELARKPGSGDRYMAVDKGWPVRICNVASDFDWSTLDRSYYIREAEKLLKVMT